MSPPSATSDQTLWIDCPTGLAGNMLLAALLDLGVDPAVIEAPLAQLGLAGSYRLVCEERRSGGLRGRHLVVELLDKEPSHRHWGDLRRQLHDSALEPELRERVLEVFGLLADVEGAVHGHSPDQVHFHEVGAMDALVDVVGVCAGLQALKPRRIVCGVPPAGSGQVTTAHGLLPVPVPAVLELARRRSIPLGTGAGFPPGELTTPTGLVLMACWADAFGPSPTLLPQAVGVGLGSRTLDRPNLLRMVLGSSLDPDPDARNPWITQEKDSDQAREETVVLQQAQIDDASAEDLAFLCEALREAGALDVFSQSVQMKKGRPGTLITALVRPEQQQRLRQVWWRHSTTLGLREQPQQRWELPREQAPLNTPLGTVRLKWAGKETGRPPKPEFEDLALLARQHDLPLAEVRRLIHRSLENRQTAAMDEAAISESAPGTAADR
ncbi:MAG: nickel pincer cofactor biosynthesis protein LarC [Cyanobacteriota bacterium]